MKVKEVLNQVCKTEFVLFKLVSFFYHAQMAYDFDSSVILCPKRTFAGLLLVSIINEHLRCKNTKLL